MSNIEIKIDDNGTKYYQDPNTLKLIFQCQYCGSWFETKRRFNQKFCSNSCKTMASRKRNEYGLTGYKNRDKTSNTTLLKSIEELNKRLDIIEKTNDNGLKQLATSFSKLNGKLSTNTWTTVFNLIANLITLWQTFEVKSKLGEENNEMKNTMKLLANEIKKEALESQELREYIKNNEELNNIFNNIL